MRKLIIGGPLDEISFQQENFDIPDVGGNEEEY